MRPSSQRGNRASNGAVAAWRREGQRRRCLQDGCGGRRQADNGRGGGRPTTEMLLAAKQGQVVGGEGCNGEDAAGLDPGDDCARERGWRRGRAVATMRKRRKEEEEIDPMREALRVVRVGGDGCGENKGGRERSGVFFLFFILYILNRPTWLLPNFSLC